MWLKNFLKSRTATSTRRPTCQSLRSSRPCVELLEGRWVPSFSAAANYPVGAGPQAVVSGDFNNGTHPDLAFANADVLLGNADGTFQPARSSAAGIGATFVAAGDFNADGKLDLVTASPGNEICALLGNGNGTFQAPSRYSIPGDSQSVAVGDFNADGKLDIGVLSNVPNEIYDGWAIVLLGTGSGTFSAPHSSYLGEGYRYAAAVADFNGDGKLDFATSSEYGTVDVALGNGAGNFGYPETFGSVTYTPAISLIAGDLNHDGKADLAKMVSSYAGNFVGVLLGNGLGSFATQTAATDSLSGSLAIADFNADGNVDLLVASAGTGTVGVLLGTGTGAFRRPVTASAGSYLEGVAVGDFNGDGRADVATTNLYSNTVSVLLNDGNWPAMSNPLLAINGVTVTEGNTGTVSATFVVSLSAASDQPVTVRYATTDGTATAAGDDYQATSGTLTFAPGETSKTITVLVNGDSLAEYNETFSVHLNDATNAFIGNDDTGLGIIVDDEPIVSISDDVSGFVIGVEGNTGTTAFIFTVTLSAAYDRPVSVDYATADLTPDEEYWYGFTSANAGIDYVPTSGTVTFAPGDTSKTITVLVNGDQLVESDEQFFVNLSNPTSASIGSGRAWGTILNDDLPSPSVSINDVSVTEGNAGTRAATFAVTLSAASSVPVTVAYSTTNGTATAGSDYQSTSGTLTIPAGQTSGTITVLVNGDRLAESNETFNVNLSGATNAILADGQGIGTILDDEPRINISDKTVTEGNAGSTSATFTVTLSAAYDVNVTVAYSTANGTATAGSDYQATSGTLTFAPGQTSKTVTVQVIGDRLPEANETFVINLSGPTNATIADAQGQGTILDDEPRISIGDVSKKEGKKGNTTLFTFTVTLSGAYDQAVTMSFRTADGTATTGDSDYVAQTGTITFKPGETTKTITIEVKGDSKKESDETFYLDLFGNGSNSLFTKNRGFGTILNDD